jgi:hypothetical protein
VLQTIQVELDSSGIHSGRHGCDGELGSMTSGRVSGRKSRRAYREGSHSCKEPQVKDI